MRILMVEDDDAVGETLEMALEDMGHDVQWSRDADGALQMMARIPTPELLVTDFNLGGSLTGVDIAETFVNHYPSAAVVVISGRPDLARRHLTARCHARFLAKPFRMDDLSAAIAEALTLAQAA